MKASRVRSQRNGTFGDVNDTTMAKKKKPKESTQSLFLLLLILFVAIQVSMFITMSYNTSIGHNRLVHIYNEHHPLIPIEELSKAEPFPPFKPLILTSPYVRSVQEDTAGMSDLQQEKGKTVQVVQNNGTVFTVLLADIHEEIQRSKQTHVAFATDLSVQGSWNALKAMGVDPAEPPAVVNQSLWYKGKVEPTVEPEVNWTEHIPPWGQILENYGAEPVVLGLDRCQAYRDAVPPEQRIVAPAGMFSTGTNLLFALLLYNCLPPPVKGMNTNTIRNRKRFAAWQAPWGKRK